MKDKKYRICSDKKFKVNEDIILTNEIIHMISLIIRYKIFYKNNEIFTENNNTYLTVDNKHLHIDNFLKCSVDRNIEGFIKLEKINEEYLKKLGYTFDFEIIGYVKIVSDIPYDENKRVMDYQKISKKEFYKILTENIDSFDNADNENCSFSFDYTEKVEGNMEIEVKKIYFKNGNLKFEVQYQNNKKNGFCKRYDENGMLVEEGQYENDIPVGQWKDYRNNELTFMFDRDKKQFIWYKNGKIEKKSKSF